MPDNSRDNNRIQITKREADPNTPSYNALGEELDHGVLRAIGRSWRIIQNRGRQQNTIAEQIQRPLTHDHTVIFPRPHRDWAPWCRDANLRSPLITARRGCKRVRCEQGRMYGAKIFSGPTVVVNDVRTPPPRYRTSQRRRMDPMRDRKGRPSFKTGPRLSTPTHDLGQRSPQEGRKDTDIIGGAGKRWDGLDHDWKTVGGSLGRKSYDGRPSVSHVLTAVEIFPTLRVVGPHVQQERRAPQFEPRMDHKREFVPRATCAADLAFRILCAPAIDS
ncbi:hypothetical protein C8R43DRAFT_1118156 [Mycena crocata]|nr:hypothetical protein C8R43DRAFT_1118156 [Mycena crocata]